jgi:GGDEF domain-containing protein
MAARAWIWIGGDRAIEAAAAAMLGGPPTAATAVAAGDLVLLDAAATTAVWPGLPSGHAFGAARAFKNAGASVYVVVGAADPVGSSLARFVLADGVLTWHRDAGRLDGSELENAQRGRPRVAVEALLAKLEPKLSAVGGETNLQRLLRFEREDSQLQRLQDAETGLFDGPYATLKLDEEWKRAHRFHQPLSLLLFDLGPGAASLSAADRRAVFAEASGVLLNECRDIDVLARFAPTIFLVLLPGTGPDGAEILANRILAALRTRLTTWASALRPAAGLAAVPSAEVPDRRAFLAVAEACLQRSQQQGTGGVCRNWQ